MHLVSAAVLEQWNALSDEQVVARVLRGQTALFEVLMRRHNERLYRTARAITRDDAEAENVMQRSYVNAYANLRQFSGNARFVTWLTRIAVDEALARVRRHRRYEHHDDNVPEAETFRSRTSADRPKSQTFAGELRDVLEGAIDGLPDGTREVFMLREVDGLSTTEVSECVGVSEDVVRTRLSRARFTLRRLFIARTGTTAPELFRFHRRTCDGVVAFVLSRILALPR
jgi:RNA polymerase sigma-70 factor, ECF subfamily